MLDTEAAEELDAHEDDDILEDYLDGDGPRGEVFGKDRHRPSGNWVAATPRTNVAGVHHRRRNVDTWIEGVRFAEANGNWYGIDLEAEPDNPHDPNAIKVIGGVAFGGKCLSWHIGYLPWPVAATMQRAVLARGDPIAAELLSIYVGPSGFTDINIRVLAPPGNGTVATRRRVET